ncbi:JAB domain-containing protein [Vibrio sp. 1180_3]|uniref:JAB domain-containing protein n=1 Tax=Vibrio sp. 1180_3 TaxID=2528832 RepID=UPI002405F31E|nr:JAB domain-containing protein [Vibrio sp. 1180_3]
MFTSPSDGYRKLMELELCNRDRERFLVIYLDQQHRFLSSKVLFEGTIDAAAVYPRVVVAEALKLNSAALLLCHNHPSGKVSPSQADRKITRRISEALALMDIRLLDHYIVGDEFYSFAEHGIL